MSARIHLTTLRDKDGAEHCLYTDPYANVVFIERDGAPDAFFSPLRVKEARENESASAGPVKIEFFPAVDEDDKDLPDEYGEFDITVSPYLTKAGETFGADFIITLFEEDMEKILKSLENVKETVAKPLKRRRTQTRERSRFALPGTLLAKGKRHKIFLAERNGKRLIEAMTDDGRVAFDVRYLVTAVCFGYAKYGRLTIEGTDQGVKIRLTAADRVPAAYEMTRETCQRLLYRLLGAGESRAKAKAAPTSAAA